MKIRKSKMFYLGIGVCVFTIGALFLPYLSTNFAQNKKERKEHPNLMPNKTPDPQDEIARSVEGSLVLQAITTKEPEWKLTKGHYSAVKLRPDEPLVTNLSFEKTGETIGISIYKFDSNEDAEQIFSNPRSYGFARKANFGDRGEKIYGQSGFLLLTFRVNNYKVTIGNGNEKLADKFAWYVLEAFGRGR